LQAETVF